MAQLHTEKKTLFLDELRVRGSVYHAAKAADVARRTAYNWRKADLEFADAWDDVLADCVDILEESAYQRALKGDVTLTIFMLKAMNPEKFRDNLKITMDQAQTREVLTSTGAPLPETFSDLDSDKVN